MSVYVTACADSLKKVSVSDLFQFASDGELNPKLTLEGVAYRCIEKTTDVSIFPLPCAKYD